MLTRTIVEKIARSAGLSEMEVQEYAREWERDRAAASVLRRYIEPGTSNLNIPLPFVPIQSEVLVEDVADLTVQIPSTFKHLLVVGQGRVNGTGGQDAAYVYAQFNGDTGANYYEGYIYQEATVLAAYEETGNTGFSVSYLVADGQPAGYCGSFFCFIPHYNSGYYKGILTFDGVGTNAGTYNSLYTGGWYNTSPVSSIRTFPDPAYTSAKLEAGSLFSFYGLA